MEEMSVFKKGNPNDAFANYFTGQSYLNMISTEQIAIGNVTFKPKCRNNWYIYHANSGGGQILLVTVGEGYYQKWNQPVRRLAPGDVVDIPSNVKHWHDATDCSYFQHIAIEVPGEDCKTEWCEEVADDYYDKLEG